MNLFLICKNLPGLLRSRESEIPWFTPDFSLTFSDQTGRFSGCYLELLEYQNWQVQIILN